MFNNYLSFFKNSTQSLNMKDNPFLHWAGDSQKMILYLIKNVVYVLWI